MAKSILEYKAVQSVGVSALFFEGELAGRIIVARPIQNSDTIRASVIIDKGPLSERGKLSATNVGYGSTETQAISMCLGRSGERIPGDTPEETRKQLELRQTEPRMFIRGLGYHIATLI